MQKTALLGISPVVFFGAAWSANLREPRLAALPFIGLFALAVGAFLAYLATKLLKMPLGRAAVFTAAGSFTNNGSIGALVVFAFLGEKAFVYVPVYRLFEGLRHYGVLFPMVKSAGSGLAPTASQGRFRRVPADPFILTALASFGGGFALNPAGVPRPGFFAPVNAILIPPGSFLTLTSIGLALRFRNIRPCLKEAGLLAGIKFTLVPASTVLFACSRDWARLYECCLDPDTDPDPVPWSPGPLVSQSPCLLFSSAPFSSAPPLEPNPR